MIHPESHIDWHRTVRLITAAVLLCIASAATAQDEDLGPLYMQPPYDRIVLKNGETVDVQKIRLPDGTRNVPAVLPAAGELQVRPLAAQNAAAEYSIPWAAIANIQLFDDLILAKAVKRTNERQFDAAFPYFSHLLLKAPQTRGLDTAVNRYLQQNAVAAYEAGEFDRALAILGSLYERNPQAPGLASGVNTVAGKIISKYLQDRNYKSARMTLDVVAETFKRLQLSVITNWRQRFERAAASQLDEASRLANARKYLAARQAIAQAVGVWPELQGVSELQARLQREHPVVSVGVLEQAPSEPVHRLDSQASERVADLVTPLLMEIRGYTAEGGAYNTSIGQYELDPTGIELTIELADPPGGEPLAAGLAASALARQLLNATNPQSPHYREALAELVDEVTVEYPQQVRIKFRRPHVRPESLLDLPMDPAVSELSDRGVFTVAESGDSRVRFAAGSTRQGAIAEVHEYTFDDDDDAVAALTRGTVDVLDRVPPWQVSRLRSTDGIVVDSYLLPTIHALVPTGRSPLTDQREFRRALCYGIDRNQIVRDVLLAGTGHSGFQTVSGPFPAGVELTDPIRYGYNGQVKPRVYDPYLAIVLATAAWNNVQKAEGVEDPRDATLPTLKLGHSTDPVARTACVEVAKNLNALDIPIELVELSADEMLRADELVDLKYVEFSSWEPVSDARQLLGADGRLGGASDYMMLSLDRLDLASNWNDVRGQLHQIHDIASTDLPLIPLWQTVNFFAYRNELTGIAPHPVRLYQDIGNWHIEHRTNPL